LSDSVTTRQLRRHFGKPALFGALAFLLAGCAGADAPLPFITSPDPETTATATPTQATPDAHGTASNATAPSDATQAAGARATGTALTGTNPTAAASTGTASSGTTAAGAASHPVVHSPARQDLPFPSFSTPAAAGARPVLNDTEKAKMQSDLEGLAKSRETKMRQDIEQAQ
jgi:hypothetical protein